MRNGAERRIAVASSAAQPTSSNRQKCSAGGSFVADRADLNTDICASSWSSVSVGIESQPSPILAALAMAASTCAPIMMGGRGARSGRGAMAAPLNCQWRPECATRSSLHSRRMISTASVNRLAWAHRISGTPRADSRVRRVFLPAYLTRPGAALTSVHSPRDALKGLGPGREQYA